MNRTRQNLKPIATPRQLWRIEAILQGIVLASIATLAFSLTKNWQSKASKEFSKNETHQMDMQSSKKSDFRREIKFHEFASKSQEDSFGTRRLQNVEIEALEGITLEKTDIAESGVLQFSEKTHVEEDFSIEDFAKFSSNLEKQVQVGARTPEFITQVLNHNETLSFNEKNRIVFSAIDHPEIPREDKIFIINDFIWTILNDDKFSVEPDSPYLGRLFHPTAWIRCEKSQIPKPKSENFKTLGFPCSEKLWEA